MRGLLVSAALASVTFACGDDGAPPPPPASVTVGAVTIATDPLTLTITPPAGGPMVRAGFVEIATVAEPDPGHYYDPRVTGDDPLTWTRPARATALDADGWLVLEGGARLRLTPGDHERDATLAIDAGAVGGAVLTRLAVPMAPGEPLYGFGESFGGANATGQVREAQFRPDDAFESGLNEAHVPVPLALWPRRGLGLFVRDRRAGAFDLGATTPDAATATFNLPARGPLAFELFVADAPLDLVRHYVAATARPAVPPRWAFAPQQWRNEHRSSAEVQDDARQMRALGIPGSTMWIDNPWQTGYNTFTFDEQRFVGIDALLAELRGLGYRVVVWSTPYLLSSGATADDYRAADAAHLFVMDDGGRTLPFPWNQGPVGLIDFTNPAAVTFWRERIARAVARGVSGFKLDYGEDVVPALYGIQLTMRLAAGDNQDLHGIFARYYHDAYLGALPPGDGFLITRAGAWGEQDRNTCIWPGDLDSDFSRHGVDNGQGERNVGGLPAAIAGGLSLSVSGYPFFGSDIGGYREGTPTTEVLIRWAQYAALGTIMQRFDALASCAIQHRLHGLRVLRPGLRCLAPQQREHRRGGGVRAAIAVIMAMTQQGTQQIHQQQTRRGANHVVANVQPFRMPSRCQDLQQLGAGGQARADAEHRQRSGSMHPQSHREDRGDRREQQRMRGIERQRNRLDAVHHRPEPVPVAAQHRERRGRQDRRQQQRRHQQPERPGPRRLHGGNSRYTAIVFSITTRSSNSRSALSCAARPRCAASIGSSCRRAMATASASASRTGTSRPSQSCVTTSRQPGTSVVIRGRAQAAASIRLFGRPSR